MIRSTQENVKIGMRFKRHVKDRDYFLDFAIYSARGKLDVKTDGDHWHASPAKAELDNLRYNDLEGGDWQ